MPSRSKTAARRNAKAQPSFFRTPAFYAVVAATGVVGLAALGLAVLGPRRFRDEVLEPINRITFEPLLAAATPPAERAWDETRPWRDHVARLFHSINTDEVRTALAERLTAWVQRLR
jgi:hypothetical protein